MRSKTITHTFIIVLVAIALFNALSPVVEISFAERRHLSQFEDLDFNDLLTGDFIEAFDEAAVDQFAFRDRFRFLKALVEFKVFGKTDNNDIVVSEDGVFKLEDSLDEESIRHLVELITEIQVKYLQDSNVYLSIIPDKSHYWDGDIPKLDYERLEELLLNNLSDLTYVDIKDALSLDDYYLTDPHWRQEELFDVLESLAQGMDFPIGMQDYEVKVYSTFFGAYYGQSALSTKPDTLKYLISNQILNAIVTHVEYPDAGEVYDEEKLTGMDAYDVFLSGASALVTIENPEAASDRELVIFRDSFSSALAPLLIESYSSITLVDLRYMSRDLLEQYVEFEGKDVLFLYSSLLVNNSEILK